MEDPPRLAVAVRMGLRYVRNLGDAEVTRIEVARQIGGEFADPADLANRTGLPVDTLEGLAAAGALESLGLGVREGMWAAGALAEIGPGKLSLVPGLDHPGWSRWVCRTFIKQPCGRPEFRCAIPSNSCENTWPRRDASRSPRRWRPRGTVFGRGSAEW